MDILIDITEVENYKPDASVRLLQENPEHAENLLGCKIQANLKWQKQDQVLHSNLRARLLGLEKLKCIAQAAIRKTITEGLFNSILVYCLPLFGGMDTGRLERLGNPPSSNTRQLRLQLSLLLDLKEQPCWIS